MKTIEKKIPVYKTVKSGTKTETFYVTEDGTEFKKEKDALTYETDLAYVKRFAEIPCMIIDSGILETSDNNWYYARNQEDLDMILDKLFEKYSYNFSNGEKFNRNHFKVGDWITAIYHDNGDSRGTNAFYTLDYIKQKYEKFLRNFE